MMKRFGRLLHVLDAAPFAQVWRIIAGYAVVPTWSNLTDLDTYEWTLVPYFLGLLIALRVFPALLRKLVRFDPALETAWRDRRNRAKQFDSYQWQKLFWISLGLTIYSLMADRYFSSQLALVAVCTVAGTCGLVTWRFRANTPVSVRRTG